MCLYLQRKTKKRDMKTNQLMKRPMGQFEVLQRTSDGYFNATKLLEQWNKSSNDKRYLDNFWKGHHLVELMSEIAENELGFKSVDFTELKNTLSVAKRGKNGSGTWMHPILFIKFAMYINPRFEYQVIKFVYDELIKNRHLAGDNYNILTAAIAKLPNADYKEVAKAIQWIVFNMTGKNLRQSATQEQLKEISEIEHSLAFSIDMGLVKDQFSLMNLLREMYNKKYRKF